jgi:hypothetical protein
MAGVRDSGKTGISRCCSEGLGFETETTHLTHFLEPYAAKHGLSINEFSEWYKNGTIHELEVDGYFFYPHESGYDMAYRLGGRIMPISVRSTCNPHLLCTGSTTPSTKFSVLARVHFCARDIKVLVELSAVVENGPECGVITTSFKRSKASTRAPPDFCCCGLDVLWPRYGGASLGTYVSRQRLSTSA